MLRLAHITDLHLPPLPRVGARALANKRVLGYLSWQRKRKHEHRGEVVAALLRDLAKQAPDHVAVTGDLTNLALHAEYSAAAAWLRDLGSPEDISVVPGNHDAYIATAPAETHDLWTPWTRGDDGQPGYPYLRRRGRVSLIGASTAVPTLPFQASGRLGPAQLHRLDTLLRREGAAGRRRVLLLHHPPQPGVVGVRKGLRDAPALRALLAETGAELVLHGHMHLPMRHALPGPNGDIPVLGAGSGSLVGHGGRPAAQYHLLTLISEGTGASEGTRVDVVSRGYDPARGAFAETGRERLALPGRASAA